jgi:toxin ParE2
MKLRFLTIAETEQTEAAEYYESQRIGLGSEFVEELDQTVGRILEHPNAWSPGSRETRSCQMKRFPYSIIYRIYGEEILVVALQHHSREPRKWEDRVFD